jgi:hypothetical protein
MCVGVTLQFRLGLHVLAVIEVIVAVAVVGIECLRAARDSSFNPWEDGLLEGVAVAILLLSPLTLPGIATVAEWVATAYLLAFYESKLARALLKQVPLCCAAATATVAFNAALRSLPAPSLLFFVP